MSKNLHLTLNLLKQTNNRRILKQQPILYPDDQIISLLQSNISHTQIDHYSSSDTLYLIKANSNIKYLQLHQHSITHLAVTYDHQFNYIIFCSVRQFAVNQLYLKSTKTHQISLQLQKLSPISHLWGCKAIPSTIINQPNSNINTQHYALITPAQISQKNGKYYFDLPQIGVPYSRIVFYGSKKKPRYQRKIYDSQLPQYVFTIYEMNIRYFRSFEREAEQNANKYQQIKNKENNDINKKLNKDKQNFLQVMNVDSFTLANHRKSQIIMNKRDNSLSKKNNRFTIGPQVTKRRNKINEINEIQNIRQNSLLYQTQLQLTYAFIQNLQQKKQKQLNLINQMSFQELVKLDERINQIRKKSAKSFIDKVQKIQQKNSINKQHYHEIKIISSNISILCPIQVLKCFNNQIQELFFISQDKTKTQLILNQYSIKSLQLLLNIKKQNISKIVQSLKPLQIIQALRMLHQCKMEVISDILISQGILSKFKEIGERQIQKFWVQLKYLQTQISQKKYDISEQVLILLKYFLLSVFSRSISIMEFKQSKLQGALLSLPANQVQQICSLSLEKLNQLKKITKQDELHVLNNRLADLLEILMGNKQLKNISQLISKNVSNKLSISINYFNKYDIMFSKNKLAIFLRDSLQNQNSLSLIEINQKQKSVFKDQDFRESIENFLQKNEYNYVMNISYPFDHSLQKEQVLISENIKIKNNVFRLLLTYNKQSSDIIYTIIKIKEQEEINYYDYFAANIKIKIATKNKLNSSFQQVISNNFYYIWCNSTHHQFNPTQKFKIIFENPQIQISKTSLLLTLSIEENIIDSATLHYLGLRMKQLLPVKMQSPAQKIPKKRNKSINNRKSCFFLQESYLYNQKIMGQNSTKKLEKQFQKMSISCLNHTLCTLCQQNHSLLYQLTQIQIFALLQNDNIQIQQEWTILLFLIKYYYKKQVEEEKIPIKKQQIKNQSLRRMSEKFDIINQINQKASKNLELAKRIGFLSLRYQFISFKKILKTFLQQQFIQKDKIYKAVIEKKKQKMLHNQQITKKNESQLAIVSNIMRKRAQKPIEQEYLEIYLKYKNITESLNSHKQ